MIIHGLITKNYGWEISTLCKIGSFRNHLSIISLDCELSLNRKYDHSPSFRFYFGLFNITLLEFNIYFIWHRDDDGNPIKAYGIPARDE